MITWIFALAMTLIACGALYYAAALRPARVAGNVGDDPVAGHFRLQLQEIEADIGAGRLAEAEGQAAKAELAREVIRAGRETRPVRDGGGRVAVALAAGAAGLLALVTYSMLGNWDMPAAPLAARDVPLTAQIDPDAVAKLEAHLANEPDDLRAWQAAATVYVEMERYADAAKAWRRVNELMTPTADTLAGLAQAVMATNNSVAGEPLELFKRALELDPKNVASRFFIAADETNSGAYEAAIADWNLLLADATGSEPWFETAKAGLAAAQQGLSGGAATPPDASQIEAMVDGLEARLKAGGGTIEEWTMLVRSRMQQGRTADAQAAYDLARAAYPEASVRTELDVLAADNGLVAK